MTLTLPNGVVATSPIGFGCGYLTGGLEARASRRLIETALAAGIRHFDTAPTYGMGMADDVLGTVLAGRRSEVTIASKVGRSRPKPLRPHVQLARVIAQPVRRHLGRWTRQLGRRMYKSAVIPGQFQRSFVEASVTDSLRRLGTDYLDLLLLHEVRLEDVTDELLTFLDERRRSGLVLAVGTATSRHEEQRILAAYGGFFDVAQHAWSPLDEAGPTTEGMRMTITHRVILRTLTPLQTWLAGDEDAKHALAAATDLDLDAPGMLPTLLLGAAVAANQNGITLAASRRAERITSNVRALTDPRFVAAGQRFLDALAQCSDRPPAEPEPGTRTAPIRQ